jgi:hypothetical protein
LTERAQGKDLDLVIDRLSKSRNNAKSLKMVTSGLGDVCVLYLTFVSVFTLLFEKSLHQEKLCDIFVGNPNPVKNNCPHSQVCFEASANPSPQKIC